ncbi:hypothetical protein MMC17_000085 [Xylographa soralifera]|nr:hypothetical protein [Xylographa soralifera]
MHTFICLTLVVVEAILTAPIAAVAIRRAEVKGVDTPKDVLPDWIYYSGSADDDTAKIKRDDDQDKVPD